MLPYGELAVRSRRPDGSRCVVRTGSLADVNLYRVRELMQRETCKLRWRSHQRVLPYPGLPWSVSAMTEVPFEACERVLAELGLPSTLRERASPANTRTLGRMHAYFLHQVDSQLVHMDHRACGEVDAEGLTLLREWLESDEAAVEAARLDVGEVVAFDPNEVHAVYNAEPVFSVGVHLDMDGRGEAVVYFVLGPGKTLLTFPGMPRRAQECLDDLGVETTAALAEGGAAGLQELRRLVCDAAS